MQLLLPLGLRRCAAGACSTQLRDLRHALRRHHLLLQRADAGQHRAHRALRLQRLAPVAQHRQLQPLGLLRNRRQLRLVLRHVARSFSVACTSTLRFLPLPPPASSAAPLTVRST